MKKFFKSLVLFFLLLILIGAIFQIRLYLEQKKIMERCVGYDPEWFTWQSINDCHGVISVSFDENNGGYSLENNIDRHWLVANIKSLDDFYLKGEDMYLINKSTPGVCNNLLPGKYCGQFRVNGESKMYYYDHPEQVPKYLIIDTKTGNEQFYVKLEDASLLDQQIFKKLITTNLH